MQTAIQEMSKMSLDDKKSIEEGIEHTLHWMEENDTAELEQIKNKQKTLEQLCNPIISKQYQK